MMTLCLVLLAERLQVEVFFQNIGDTRRIGTELGLSGVFKKRLNWYMNYSFVEATYENAFIGVSANHPNKIDLDGDGTASEIQVESGDRIPGIPEHSFKIGGNYAVNDRLSVGISGIYNSDQMIRGDESNQLDPVDGYFITNVNATYKINKKFTLFAKVNNLFDNDYESFGLLGEADEISMILKMPDFLVRVRQLVHS
ncbi:MAG: TonB-dependent receptor domain-containing protein [Gammaproteobacteria bacterium]